VPTGVAARSAVPAGCTGTALACTGWPDVLHRKGRTGDLGVLGDWDTAAAVSDDGGVGGGVAAVGRPGARRLLVSV